MQLPFLLTRRLISFDRAKFRKVQNISASFATLDSSGSFPYLRTMTASGKRALVIIATGSEEMEAVIVANVMRRAGIDVVLAGLDGADPVVCARKVRILPDMPLEDAVKSGKFDAVVLPGGGEGAKNLASSDAVKVVLRDHESSGKFVAAVCAAPTAFKSHDIAKGKKITSYPSFKGQLEDSYNYSEDAVVQDGKIITSRGPGTCFQFALKLVENLVDTETAENLKKGMLVNF